MSAHIQAAAEQEREGAYHALEQMQLAPKCVLPFCSGVLTDIKAV
jgi:hypothetical protein